MSSEILNLLFIFLLALLFASVSMSLYLLYDIRSGNYRKLLPAGKKDKSQAEK